MSIASNIKKLQRIIDDTLKTSMNFNTLMGLLTFAQNDEEMHKTESTQCY